MSSLSTKNPSNSFSRHQSSNTHNNGTKLIPLRTNPTISTKSAFHKKDSIPNKSPDQASNKDIVFSRKLNQSKFRAQTEASALPMKASQLISPTMQSNGFHVSDFVSYIHKRKPETLTLEESNRSFISFRNMPNGDPPIQGGGEHGEIFMSPSQADHWKKQLKLNKQRETLFKQTIKDIFVQSNQNFYKLCEVKDKQMQKMPRVKIYTTTNSYRNDRNKISFLEPIHSEILPDDKNQDKISEYSSRAYISKNEPCKFHISPQGDPTLRRPYAREGASLTLIGKNIYLYGGVSKEVYNEWEMLDTTTWIWSKIPVKGDIPPYGRYGHSADRYLNSIVIFGGEKNYNTILKIRECVSDVRIFTPENNEWKYVKTQGEFVEPRRNHIGVVVGKHLLIHGGIDTSGYYLSDIKILNLVNNKWTSSVEKGEEPIAVAFHKACLVVSTQRKELNLFRFNDLKEDNGHSKIKEEGIYFFGGKTADGEVLDTLKVLKIGVAVFKWITPETFGRPADARYLHTMVLCRKLNSLLIYGGRSDGLISGRRPPFLGDFHLLQLDTLTWVNVIVGGTSPDPRCSHSMTLVGSKIIVFGGIHYNTYCPPEHQVYEVDPAIIRTLEKKVDAKRSVEILDVASKVELFPPERKPKSNLGTIVSFLPLPITEDSPKKLRQLTRKEAMDRVLGQVKHYEEQDF